MIVMVLFIDSNLPKVALHAIAGVLFEVIVYKNLLELIVMPGLYITVEP